MYKRVEGQMVIAGISKKILAQKLGIGYTTLLQKMNGSSAFTLDEALEIKKIINSTEPIEMLFNRSA